MFSTIQLIHHVKHMNLKEAEYFLVHFKQLVKLFLSTDPFRLLALIDRGGRYIQFNMMINASSFWPHRKCVGCSSFEQNKRHEYSK